MSENTFICKVTLINYPKANCKNMKDSLIILLDKKVKRPISVIFLFKNLSNFLFI